MNNQEYFHALPKLDGEKGNRQISRRKLLKLWSLGLALSTLRTLEVVAWKPQRMADAAPTTLPNIQFDIHNFIAPVQIIMP